MYEKIIKIWPKEAEAHSDLGLMYENEGKLEEAEVEYKISENIAYTPPIPNRTENGYLVLGEDYLAGEKITEATKAFEKAISFASKSPEVYNKIALAYISGAKPDKAIENLEKAITLDPQYGEAYNNLGLVYFDRGEMDKAINNYKKAIETKQVPAMAEAYNNLGNVYQRQGKIKEAIAEFKKSCGAGKKDICVWLESNQYK